MTIKPALFALAVLFAGFESAQAAPVTYRVDGMLEGSSIVQRVATLVLDLDGMYSTFEETLADGTRHIRYASPPPADVFAPSGPVKSWSARVTPAFYEGRSFGYGEGSFIDRYLSPDNSSALTVNWNFDAECHGGCGQWWSFAMSIYSDDSTLFSPGTTRLPSSFRSGNGAATYDYIDIVDWENAIHQRSAFTITSITAVPEAETGTLLLAGLCALVMVRRRVKNLQ